MAKHRLSFTDFNLILQIKNVIGNIKKLSGADYRKITLFNLWIGRSILHQRDLRNEDETSTSVSVTNLFKLCVLVHIIGTRMSMWCFRSHWRQSKHPSIHHKIPDPSTRSKICDGKIMDHLIMYVPKNVHLTNYSQDGNFDISKAAIMSLSLQTMTVFHVDC